MRKTIARVALGVVIAGLLACCIGTQLVFQIFRYPSAEDITQNFFEAVVAGDINRAVKFTTKSYRDGSRYEFQDTSMDCEAATRRYAEQLMTQFAGVETRNVSYSVNAASGSWDRPNWGHVAFEYKQPVSATWQTAEITLLTIHDDYGIRYACGRRGGK